MTDSPKSEGFLKTVWHKLTDNPASSNEETKDGSSSRENTLNKDGTPMSKEEESSKKDSIKDS